MTAHVPPRCGVGGVMIWVLFSKPYIHPKSRLFKVSSSIKPWCHQVCSLTRTQSAGVRHPRIGVLTYIVLLLSSDEWLTLILEFPPPHYLLANEADEGLKYKGRKADVVTTAPTKVPPERRAAGTGFTSSVSHVVFCRETFLVEGRICKVGKQKLQSLQRCVVIPRSGKAIQT